MRRFSLIILAILLSAFGLRAQVDTTKFAELDARLGQYFSFLESEPAETKKVECDALIEAASDPSLRQRIALKIYDHYRNSPLMGDEAVAIHLTDKWFSTGKIAMASDQALLDAKLFADFNRQSLIGMRAPEATLRNPFGEEVTIPVVRQAHQPEKGRYQILYFYDTDCVKCKVESAMLRSFLDDKNYPVDVFAIYVGSDKDSWMRWRGSTFILKKGETTLSHLWDPDDESGFQLKYGVTVTPRMFLLDPDGIIVGRGLDTDALEKLLSVLVRPVARDYEYGSEEAVELFDRLFATYGQVISAENVTDLASLLKERTLDAGDTLSFKHMEGDLLYYLSSQRTEGYKNGSALFINDYILSRPDIWNTPEDTLKVVGLAQMLDGLMKKAPVGATIPKTPIKGWNKMRRKGGFFIFATNGCPVCASETSVADLLHLAYLKVDMDALARQSPEVSRQLLDFFDLSSLPQIVQVGKKGVIKRRYLSFSEHLLFLREKE